MPPQAWKTLSTRLVYQNPWTSVHEDIAEMPNGRTTIYGVVEAGQCVGVLPFLEDGQVILVRQYRYVFGENQRWEMPTGGVRPGEGLLEAARRELREAIGKRDAPLVTEKSTALEKLLKEAGAVIYAQTPQAGPYKEVVVPGKRVVDAEYKEAR